MPWLSTRLRQQSFDQQARRADDGLVGVQWSLFGDRLDAPVDAGRATDVARAKERLQRLAPGPLRVPKRWPSLQEVGENDCLLVCKPSKTCGK